MGLPRLRPLPSLLMMALCLPGCGAQPERESSDYAPVETGRTFVYECDDYEFVARTGPGEVALYLPYDYLVLGQVRAASGVKYSGDGVTFWSKGQEALLDLGFRQVRGCVNNTARVPWEEASRRGVDFRGIGQEPGWFVEIQRGRQILFVGSYGDQRLLAAAPEPQVEESITRFVTRAADRSLVVELRDEPCSDSMSGEAFEATVTVSVDEQVYRGCGRYLENRWR